MSRPPRILLPHTVVMLTSRVQQGLPFVCSPLMQAILWSALAVAQSLHPLKIISFVVMGNHIHIIALVEDPQTVESFMERFKCETGHAVNRLLGRRQVTVWCEGYDSPAILTVNDLVEKIAYVYANPVRAHRCASIDSYQGVSSWQMFTSGHLSKDVKRIRRAALGPVSKGRVSVASRQQEVSWVEQQTTEVSTFTLSPDAWVKAFPGQSTPEHFKERVLKRIREIEQEMHTVRAKENIKVPSDFEVATQPIDTLYSPKTFGRRTWCICGDIPLRMAFISFIKRLRAKARAVRLKWLSGDQRETFPTGLFPPCQPILASLPPFFVRRCLATA